jgi:hypothetical protein
LKTHPYLIKKNEKILVQAYLGKYVDVKWSGQSDPGQSHIVKAAFGNVDIAMLFSASEIEHAGKRPSDEQDADHPSTFPGEESHIANIYSLRVFQHTLALSEADSITR